jgi:hypothetical protein
LNKFAGFKGALKIIKHGFISVQFLLLLLLININGYPALTDLGRYAELGVKLDCL